MSLPVKLTIGTLTLGSIGGATYAGIVYSQKGTPINELIKKEYKYILLDTSSGTANTDNTYWKTNSTKYKAEQTAGNDIFKLPNWVKASNADLTEALKTKCIQISKLTVYENKDENYINATKYCGRSVTIKDQLDKDNIVPIDKGVASSIWEGIANKKAKLQAHFNNLKIKPASASVQITADNVKDGCVAALEKDKSDKEFSTIYASFKEVCVSKG